MSEEPAWKAKLRDTIEVAIGISVDCGGTEGVRKVRDVVLNNVLPHIKAAEQRGFSAGSSKAGTRLKAENERLRRKLRELDQET